MPRPSARADVNQLHKRLILRVATSIASGVPAWTSLDDMRKLSETIKKLRGQRQQ